MFAKQMLIGILVFALVLSSGLNVMAKDAPLVIRISHLQDVNSVWQAGCVKFKELVEQKSNGRVEVKIFPNSQIGNEKDSLEGLRMGTLEITLGASGPLASWDKKLSIFAMPYLFRDANHVRKVLTPDGIGGQMAEELRVASGIRTLAWWDRTPRNLTSNKPIKTLADLKGLKIRVPQAASFVETWKALGANPVPMAWPEVYPALQQGVIEAQENPLDFIYNGKIQEVQKYLLLIEYVRLQVWFNYSDLLWQKLPPDLRQIVRQAAVDAGKYHDQLLAESDQGYLEKLKATMQVLDLDPKLLMDATKDVYKKFVNDFGEDLYLKIQAVQ